MRRTESPNDSDEQVEHPVKQCEKCSPDSAESVRRAMARAVIQQEQSATHRMNLIRAANSSRRRLFSQALLVEVVELTRWVCKEDFESAGFSTRNCKPLTWVWLDIVVFGDTVSGQSELCWQESALSLDAEGD